METEERREERLLLASLPLPPPIMAFRVREWAHMLYEEEEEDDERGKGELTRSATGKIHPIAKL